MSLFLFFCHYNFALDKKDQMNAAQHVKKFEKLLKGGRILVYRDDLHDADGDPAFDCIPQQMLEMYMSQGWKKFKGTTEALPEPAEARQASFPPAAKAVPDGDQQTTAKASKK